jgi:hypothetical protein
MAQTREFRGRASEIVADEHAMYFRYHNTTVVAVSPKSVCLNSGGWRTVTTKLRMNQASNQFGLGFQVWQKDFNWYVTLPNGETVDFEDGITFSR